MLSRYLKYIVILLGSACLLGLEKREGDHSILRMCLGLHRSGDHTVLPRQKEQHEEALKIILNIDAGWIGG